MSVVGIVAVYRGGLRPWMYSWGADDAEVAAALPGDELVSTDVLRTTRALTIEAPRTEVWPWLVQIGEGRGGFYSYSPVERAVGARIRNADAVNPAWQDIQVGDSVWLARRYGDNARQIVALLEQESHLVLMAPADFVRMCRGKSAAGAWGFYLRATDGQTRLIVRGSGGLVGHASFDLVHFAMEQKMMRGIRERAERRDQRTSGHHMGSISAPRETPRRR
jgi:hypothetical protein